MAMQTHVMSMMALDAHARTTQRPLRASAALRVTGRTATDIRQADARDHFTYRGLLIIILTLNTLNVL